MARTQKNKATSFHLGQLKAKLAKLKRELLTPTSSGGGGGGAGFDVARTGVASVGFIGFPSVGKSTLMTRLTGQHSEAAAYEFTTLTSVPGQVMYNGRPSPIPKLRIPGAGSNSTALAFNIDIWCTLAYCEQVPRYR